MSLELCAMTMVQDVLHIAGRLVRHHSCWVGQVELVHYVEVMRNVEVQSKNKKPPKDTSGLNASRECCDVR